VSRTVVIAPKAQAQLDALYDYIADAASADIALWFNDALLDQFESLRDFPVRGTAHDDILPG
jgi:toxin ParE1/3/4